jgi:hypothetical protein
MNVIKVKNLKMPAPSKEEMRELRAGLAALAGPDDPITLSVSVENWPGRQAMHLVYYAGLRTLTEIQKLDESKLGPLSWRFFAGGHKTVTSATGCTATHGHPGLPLKVMAVTRGPAAAEVLRSTEMLNDLRELSDSLNNQYELRVLRMPALGTETFWLKSLSAEQGDWIVPYGSIPDALIPKKPDAPGTPNGNQVISVDDFLNAAANAARQRLAKPDIAEIALRRQAREAPVNHVAPPSKHLPRPAKTLP